MRSTSWVLSAYLSLLSGHGVYINCNASLIRSPFCSLRERKMSIIFSARKSLLKSEMAILYLTLAAFTRASFPWHVHDSLRRKANTRAANSIKSCNISPTLHHNFFFRNLPSLFQKRLLAKYIPKK